MKKDFSPQMLEIRDRILGLKNKFGIEELKRGGRLARKLGVHNSVITRLIDKESVPTIENIKSICLNAKVTANWLLFGIEKVETISEIDSEKYEAPTYSEDDVKALAKITIDADDFLKKSRLSISPERKYYWMWLNYEYWFTNRQKPDNDVFKENLNLSLGMVKREQQ